MWLHARKMKKSWIFEKSERSSFLSFKKSFLRYAMYDEFGPKKQGESAWKYPWLLFYDVKTSKESKGTILVTIRCLHVATCSENEEKLDFRKKIPQWLWYYTCKISYVASFLVQKIKGSEWKWYLLLFYNAKTSRESNDMLYMTIRCVNVPTSHQNDEKVDFSSNFGVYFV